MYSYDQQDSDQLLNRLTLVGLGAITAGLFLRNKNSREALGQRLVSGIHSLGVFAESRIFSGTLRDVRNSVTGLKNAKNLSIEHTSLGNAFTSFERFVSRDLAQQGMHDLGVSSLVKQGWSNEEARVIFNPSNSTDNIFRKESVNAFLASDYAEKYIRSNVPSSRFTKEGLAQIEEAKSEALKLRVARSSNAYMEANRLFALNLKERSIGLHKQADNTLGAFGISHKRFGDLTDPNLFKEMRSLLSSKIHTEEVKRNPEVARKNFLDKLTERLNTAKIDGFQLSNIDLHAAKAAVSLHLAGEAAWESVVRNLPTEIITSGDRAYNIRAINNLVKEGFETVANNFMIPIAPGQGGMLPLKFMPWLRGGSRDFAGTLSAGTKQRELYEAFPEEFRKKIFDTNYQLTRNVHFIGNKVFGTSRKKTTEIISLPDSINKYNIKDSRFGLQEAFSRIRNNNDYSSNPRSSFSTFFEGSFIGKGLDYLHLGRQATPSELKRATSSIGKYIFPKKEEYVNHPLNALNRVLKDQSNLPSDISAVIRGVKRHTSIPEVVDPRSLFTEDILNRLPDVNEGFKKLIRDGFNNESLATALREIDAAVANQPLENTKYFNAKDVVEGPIDLFHGAHTRMNARRFAQNDVGLLNQGVLKEPDPGIIHLRGLFGDAEALNGFGKIRDTFYDEIFAQINRGSNSSEIFAEISKNAEALEGLSKTQKDSLVTGIWANHFDKYLKASFSDQSERAESIGDILRTTSIGGLFNNTLKKYHGGLTPWVKPSLEETGAHLYATPQNAGVIAGLKATWDAGKLSPLKSILNESTPGMGDSVSPGWMYHIGFRLNDMLAKTGLGLPDADMQNISSITSNIFFKRVVPAFGIVGLWKYANYSSNQMFGYSPDDAFGNVRAHAALATSFIGDKLHITPHLKALVDLSPGVDAYIDPKTYKEQEDYLNTGYTPVRKGRLWLAGSRSTFAGDKISYYKPSWYQLEQSHYQEVPGGPNSDFHWAKDSWAPTPAHIFAPIYKLFHPYAWETYHAKDYPTIKSSPIADPNTLWGNIINATIGRFLKPERVFHPEYLNPENPEYSNTYSGNGLPSDILVNFSNTGNYSVQGRSVGSGGKGNSVGVVSGGYSDINGSSLIENDQTNLPLRDGNSPILDIKRGQEQWWDLVGIYGYGKRQLWNAFGRPQTIDESVIDTASTATSYERKFYDKNMGGFLLGSQELSEFWRRIIPHRDRSIKLWDPVRNSQPSWLPGDGELINFQHGLSYTKIPLGEQRLPGPSYKAIHQIDHYETINKVEILADSSPFSNAYKTQVELLRQEIASSPPEIAKELQNRLNAAESRASIQKKMYQSYNYRFNQDTETQKLTVKGFLDANTIQVEESKHPIRLAGVGVSNSRLKEYIKEQNIRVKEGQDILSAFYSTFGIEVGGQIKAVMNTWDNNQVSDDLLRTKHAAVFVGHHNINRELIESGVGIEKNDNSAPGIITRYSPLERLYGNLWEKFAHHDDWIHCISPWTQIITKNGIKEAKDLSISDSVLTSKGRYKKVLGVKTQPVGKTIVDIKIYSSNIRLTTTDDHPILAVKAVRKTSHNSRGKVYKPWTGSINPTFIKPQDLAKYDYVVFKPEIMLDTNPADIDLATLNPRTEFDDSYVWVRGGNNPKMAVCDRFVKVDENLTRLMGYYAAEGSIKYNSTKRPQEISLVFCDTEVEYIEDVYRLIKKVFNKTATIRHGKNDNSVTIRVSSVYIAEIMEHFIGVKDTKKAPKELLTNNKLRAEFFRGLFRGDATKSETRGRYDSLRMVAIELLSWSRDCLANLWNIPSSIGISHEQQSNMLGFAKNSKILYKLYVGKWDSLASFIDGYNNYEKEDFTIGQENIHCNKVCIDGYIYYRIKEIELSDYQGTTLDIEVDEDSDFATLNADVHNTKFLKVRSALEKYEREQVYGSAAGDWASPIQTYAKPTLDALSAKNPISATLFGALIGSFFMKSGPAKKLGAIAGGIAGLSLSGRRMAIEAFSGERYIPKRVMKRREVEEYYDTLKYIKYNRLMEQYAEKASQYENVDILKIADQEELRGERYKNKIRDLEDDKRNILLSDMDKPLKNIKTKRINEAIAGISNYNNGVMEIGPLAAKALMYRGMSRRTLIGSKKGQPLDDTLAGLPKYERELAMDIIQHGSSKEKKEYFSLLTKRQKSVLGGFLGIDKRRIPERETLREYFKDHQLPDTSWEMYDEGHSLDDARVMTATEEGIYPTEMHIFPRNISDARIHTKDIPIPVVHGKSIDIQRTLHELLSGEGIQDISIDLNISDSDESSSDISFDLIHNRNQEIVDNILK